MRHLRYSPHLQVALLLLLGDRVALIELLQDGCRVLCACEDGDADEGVQFRD